MKAIYRLQVTLIIAAAAMLAFVILYLLSLRLALSSLSDWESAPEELAAIYDQERVRAAFALQMLPQVDRYPPPWTKDVVLDAL